MRDKDSLYCISIQDFLSRFRPSKKLDDFFQRGYNFCLDSETQKRCLLKFYSVETEDQHQAVLESNPIVTQTCTTSRNWTKSMSFADCSNIQSLKVAVNWFLPFSSTLKRWGSSFRYCPFNQEFEGLKSPRQGQKSSLFGYLLANPQNNRCRGRNRDRDRRHQQEYHLGGVKFPPWSLCPLFEVHMQGSLRWEGERILRHRGEQTQPSRWKQTVLVKGEDRNPSVPGWRLLHSAGRGAHLSARTHAPGHHIWAGVLLQNPALITGGKGPQWTSARWSCGYHVEMAQLLPDRQGAEKGGKKRSFVCAKIELPGQLQWRGWKEFGPSFSQSHQHWKLTKTTNKWDQKTNWGYRGQLTKTNRWNVKSEGEQEAQE